jgi:hypothetical protein
MTPLHRAYGVIDTACISKISIFEFIGKKGFSPLIGALDGCFNEKKQKSRDTVPLNSSKYMFWLWKKMMRPRLLLGLKEYAKKLRKFVYFRKFYIGFR